MPNSALETIETSSKKIGRIATRCSGIRKLKLFDLVNSLTSTSYISCLKIMKTKEIKRPYASHAYH